MVVGTETDRGSWVQALIASGYRVAEVTGARVLAEFGDDPPATPMRRPARTTPAPVPSPGPPARATPSRPATSATTASPTRCRPRRSPPCGPHPAPAATTPSNAPARSATTPLSASSATASSASSTDAQNPHSLRRSNCLVASRPPPCRLTPNDMGCLTRPPPSIEAAAVTRRRPASARPRHKHMHKDEAPARRCQPLGPGPRPLGCGVGSGDRTGLPPLLQCGPASRSGRTRSGRPQPPLPSAAVSGSPATDPKNLDGRSTGLYR